MEAIQIGGKQFGLLFDNLHKQAFIYPLVYRYIMKQEIKQKQYGKIILDQVQQMKINGFPLLAYLGGKSFVYSDDSLHLHFAKNYRVDIYYDLGQDLYNIHITKGKFPKDKLLNVINGVFVDQLAEIIHKELGSP